MSDYYPALKETIVVEDPFLFYSTSVVVKYRFKLNNLVREKGRERVAYLISSKTGTCLEKEKASATEVFGESAFLTVHFLPPAVWDRWELRVMPTNLSHIPTNFMQKARTVYLLVRFQHMTESPRKMLASPMQEPRTSSRSRSTRS